MKARIKRQDVECFRNTEKINCHIKYSEMKDTGLSFDLFFSIYTGSLKTETTY